MNFAIDFELKGILPRQLKLLYRDLFVMPVPP